MFAQIAIEESVGLGRVVIMNVLLVSVLLATPASKTHSIPIALEAAITATRHAVEPDGTGYKGTNPRQKLELRFEGTAARVRAAEGEVQLRLAGYGRGNHMNPPMAAVLTAAQNRVEYHRGVLTEWYVNDHRGLEQGFTLMKRPAGVGVLTVALAVDGDMTLHRERGGVVLERNGRAVLRYAELKAWDAGGHTLPTEMEVTASQIRLLVKDTGAAYPVTIDPWLQQAKLTFAPVEAPEMFGISVALSGNTALVGQYRGPYSGAAYVYVRSGIAWTEQAKLAAPDGIITPFGNAVALSGDTALVGASGTAYVYVRSGTSWMQQSKLIASDGRDLDGFGCSVALSGDTALVGADRAGAAYVYLRNGAAWTQQAKLRASDGVAGGQFGYSVALDGDTAIVGSQYAVNGKGAVYVNVRSGITWTEQAKLTASDGAFNDAFGHALALSGDTVVVAAYGKNAAYVYGRSGHTWTQQARLAGAQGSVYSVALSGDTALVGAGLNAEAAYVYVRTGTAWIKQAKLTAFDGKTGDEFGYSVALSGDTTIVGAPAKSDGNGSAYIYESLVPTANLTSNLASGSPFTPLTLAGSGFAPDESIIFTSTGTSTVSPETFTTDANGTFTLTGQVPQAPHGPGVIEAIGQVSGKLGVLKFWFTPRLIMSPNMGTAGSRIVAQGFGFGGDDYVSIYWSNPLQFLGNISADSHGSFAQSNGLTFTIPAGAPKGSHVVWGQGQPTGVHGKGPVTVQ